jgi:hypothetical protein
MSINVKYSTGSGDFAILAVGDHPCRLTDLKPVTRPKFQSDEMQQQLQWTFTSLSQTDEEGRPMIISQWTGFGYGAPNAKLTGLLDQFFGRALTEEEIEQMDMERLVGHIQGYVMVLPHTKQDGSKTTKFGAFRAAPQRALPQPKQFYREAAGAIPATRSKDEPVIDTSDLEDPFAG